MKKNGSHIEWKKAALLAGLLVLGTHSARAAANTWVSAASDSWSDAAAWSNGVPSTSGDDLTFTALTLANQTSTIDSVWATSGGVNSLTFLNGATNNNFGYTFTGSPTTNTLTIGAGGLNNQATTSVGNHGGEVIFNVNLILGADQTWKNLGAVTQGDVNIAGNLSGAGNLTKIGNGYLIFSGSGTNSGWTGALTLNEGTVDLSNAAQLTRLGSTMNWGDLTNTTLQFAGLTTSNTTYEFGTNLAFVNTASGTGTYTINNSANPTVGGVLDFNGNMTGTALTHAVTFSSANTATGAVSKIRLKGNNSGLTFASSLGTLGGASGITIRAGFVYLDTANALGAGNGIYTGVGQSFSNTLGSNAGLYTTNGNNVTANLLVNRNQNSTAVTEEAYLGLDGAGAATYSGTIMLESTLSTTSGQSTHKAANLHLSASTGGTATFSGLIEDKSGSDDIKTQNVYVDGGGTVVLNHNVNSYSATTTVESGTTLLVNGLYSTGTGAVNVGYNANTTLTGSTAANNSNVLTMSSVAGLVVGQGISGTGIPAGSVIVGINTANNTIAISNNIATQVTNLAIAAAASTGATLGGTGSVFGLVTAAGTGSIFSPGANGATGTLTLSGGLNAPTGATFNFLINGSTPSLIDFGGGALTLGGTDVFNFSTSTTIATGTLLTLFTGSGTWTGTPTFQFSTPAGYALDTTYGTNGYLWDTVNDTLTVEFVTAAIPEPGILPLLLLAALVGGGLRFRRRHGITA